MPAAPPSDVPAAKAPAPGVKKLVTKLGLAVTREENFAQWYTEVITKGECIEYYDVSGCYILRPWIYHVWESMQDYLNVKFKKHKVKNSYFPMFVTKSRLEAEESHIEGFSAEVAWVTKYGSSDLAEPIAIRPTSETIMYPIFAKWIRSHRDLPLKVNQWCPVVRWEFSSPQPFIRTREFLWQEGHTAHASIEEADAFARTMLDAYASAYEELFAVPVTKGRKSELEKFAGGHKTYTVEVYVSGTGRSLQAGTSHNLASNFAKIFGVNYLSDSGEEFLVSQTSFGLSTRSLGAMIMVHGDNKGLVLPPRVAPVQVVIVPIYKKDLDEQKLMDAARELTASLEEQDIRAECDDRTVYSPGWKYNHWEQKGVPVRIEIGPRDLEQGTCRLVRRFDGVKTDMARDDNLIEFIKSELDFIQTELLKKARATAEAHLERIDSFDQILPALEKKNFMLAPWCERNECEEKVKKDTAQLGTQSDTTLSCNIKTLCIPFDQPTMAEDTKCFACAEKAKVYCMWGRSY